MSIHRALARYLRAAGICLGLAMAIATGAARAQPLPTIQLSTQGAGRIGSPGTSASCTGTCSASVPYGTRVTLVATPAAGNSFSGWLGDCQGTGSCSFTVTSNRRITAAFAALPPPPAAIRALTLQVSGGGAVTLTSGGASTLCSSTCTQTYASGASVRLSAMPGAGQAFNGWGGACTGTADCTLTLDANKAATASFSAVASNGGRTIYVDALAANDNGDGSAAAPKKYIRSGMALMSATGGDTVVIRPGTYGNSADAITGAVPGTAVAWNVIKAEIDGSVRITAPFSLPLGDHYLRFEGLVWDSPTQKSISGRYVKLMRCGFRGGPPNGNTMGLAIGTNDATPGAQYILVEDSYAWGPGGRNNVLVYNADKVVLRRLVARHEGGWSDTKGDPQSAVSLYNSRDVLTQNLLIVDSGAPGYFEAALYHPSSGVNGAVAMNTRNVGAMILNTAGTAVGWDGIAPSSGNLLEDSVIWRADSAVVINGSAHQGLVNRVTMVDVARGVSDWMDKARVSVRSSIVWNAGVNAFRGVVHSGNVCFKATNCSGEASYDPATSGLLYLPRIEEGSPLAGAGASGGQAGATILKRLGAPGTLWGEAGFDQPSSQDLWPWPQEARIRQAMCTEAGAATGFCAAPSLSHYVWQALGRPMPAASAAR